jgi:hypothetical protein
MWITLFPAVPFAAGFIVPRALHVAPRWQQPISAVFLVPVFYIWTWWWVKHNDGNPVHFLFPVLYALQALLILVGVPLYVRYAHPFPNIWLSFGGCLALALLGSHLYNRYALRRLRRLAVSPESGAEQGEPHA